MDSIVVQIAFVFVEVYISIAKQDTTFYDIVWYLI